jgi:hypothetical protein
MIDIDEARFKLEPADRKYAKVAREFCANVRGSTKKEILVPILLWQYLEMQTMFTLVTECTLRAAHICTGSIVS